MKMLRLIERDENGRYWITESAGKLKRRLGPYRWKWLAILIIMYKDGSES
jgi:hypothetical protein